MLPTFKKTFALPVVAALASLCLGAAAQEPNPTAVAPGARRATLTAEGMHGT